MTAMKFAAAFPLLGAMYDLVLNIPTVLLNVAIFALAASINTCLSVATPIVLYSGRNVVVNRKPVSSGSVFPAARGDVSAAALSRQLLLSVRLYICQSEPAKNPLVQSW